MAQRLARNDYSFHKYTILLLICLYILIIQLDAEIIVPSQGVFSNPSIFSLYNPTNLQRKNLQNIFNQQQSLSKSNNNQVLSELKNDDGQKLKTQIINKPMSNFPNQKNYNSQLPDTYGGLTLFNLANTIFNPNQNDQRFIYQSNQKTKATPVLSQQIKNNSPFNFFKDQPQVNTPLIQIKPQNVGSNRMMDKIDLVDFENELKKAKKQVDFQIFDVPSIQSSTNRENFNMFPKVQIPQNQIKQNDYSFPNIASRPSQYNNVLSGLQKSINERFNNFFPV